MTLVECFCDEEDCEYHKLGKVYRTPAKNDYCPDYVESAINRSEFSRFLPEDKEFFKEVARRMLKH